MTNQEVNEYMQRFLDDDLNEEELEALMEHIRLTPASALLFERLQRLDSELEQLPKVFPPMSIVDSILPRLELAGVAEQPSVIEPSTIDGTRRRAAPIEHRATLRDRVNFRVLGGVVAAGIVLTLFFSNFGPQMSFNIADEDSAANMSLDSIVVAEGNAELTNEAATSKIQEIETGQGDAKEEISDVGTFGINAADQPSTQMDINSATTNDAADTPTPWVDNGSSSGFAETPGSEARVGEESLDTAPDTAPATKASPEEPISEEEPAEERMMLTTTAQLPTVVSPNELLTGTVTNLAEGGQQIFITDQNGNQVYESEVYLGSLHELTWSPDSSQLHFEAKLDNETTVHMTIFVGAKMESIKKAE